MGVMKQMATDVSKLMGFGGIINKQVMATSQVVYNHLVEQKKERQQVISSVIESMKNAKKERLFKQGKLMKVVCAWCKEETGYKEGNGIPEQVTHGICEECAEKLGQAQRVLDVAIIALKMLGSENGVGALLRILKYSRGKWRG